MSRATRAEINLSALLHNLSIARARTRAKIMAVIKANAYGHGLIEVAHQLSAADGFAVATVDEAMSLRESGVYKPILLLQGFTSATDLRFVHAYDLHCVIHNEQQVELLEQDKGKPITLWMKIDSGMHRLGFTPQQAAQIYSRLQQCENVHHPVYFMTHLACADDESSDYTKHQLAEFKQVLSELTSRKNTHISIANSAALLAWPETYEHTDWVRPGIMLYGSSPLLNTSAEQLGLKPVMSLKSAIIAIHQIKKGQTVGYGQTYTCNQDQRIATIAIGYGDGYPRHAKNGTPVLIHGQHCPLVGRVSMDMITVDVSKLDNVNLGDEVVLWGDGLSADTVAQYADTISYELFCAVTQRVNYEYS